MTRRVLSIVGLLAAILWVLAGATAVLMGNRPLWYVLAAPLWLGLTFIILMIVTFPLWAGGVIAYRRARATAVLAYLDQAMQMNLPLPAAMDAAARSERGRLRECLTDLAEHLEQGTAIGESLRLAVPEMPRFVAAQIVAAERLHQLPQTVTRLIHRQKLMPMFHPANWAYPMMVCLSTLVVLIVFVRHMSGILSDFFGDDIKHGLPLTRALVAFGEGLNGWMEVRDNRVLLPLILNPVPLKLLLVSLILLGWWRGWHWRILDVVARGMWPLRWVIYSRDLADVCHLLAQSSQAGLPLPEAIDEARQVPRFPLLRRRLGRWSQHLRAGVPLGEAARQARLPRLMVGLLATADASARMAEMFGFLASTYEFRYGRFLALLRGILVPLVMTALGLLVAWAALALFVPLMEMVNECLIQTGFL